MQEHEWDFITDLPDNWGELVSEELNSLAPIWRERADALKETAPELRQFNERLKREWAIETGIIEGIYSIDRGTTQLLIEQGISASLIEHGSTDKPVSFVVDMIKDQEGTLDFLFEFVKQERSLSTSFIKQLHQDLTRHQETVDNVDPMGRPTKVKLKRGEWKLWPNNPKRPDGTIYHYCPPIQVQSEMDALIRMHEEHCRKEVTPEVEAAWLHHRFTQIHPFQDGNGRVARALASLVFLRAHWFPLTIHRDTRKDYITALECADDGDLKPLVTLFAEIQKKAFVRALSLAEDVTKEQVSLQQIISAASERLKARSEAKAEERQKVFILSKQLEEFAKARLQQIARQINGEIKQFDDYHSWSNANTADNSHWFKYQIGEVAKAIGYYADTNSYRSWVRLLISEERIAELVISFHALGYEFLGVMAASAFIEFKPRGEDRYMQMDGPYALCPEVFQFAYNEPEDIVMARFRTWIENVLLNGLDQWRKQL